MYSDINASSDYSDIFVYRKKFDLICVTSHFKVNRLAYIACGQTDYNDSAKNSTFVPRYQFFHAEICRVLRKIEVEIGPQEKQTRARQTLTAQRKFLRQ